MKLGLRDAAAVRGGGGRAAGRRPPGGRRRRRCWSRRWCRAPGSSSPASSATTSSGPASCSASAGSSPKRWATSPSGWRRSTPSTPTISSTTSPTRPCSGAVRGEPPVDRAALARILLAPGGSRRGRRAHPLHRPQPADRGRRGPGGRRRAGGDRPVTPAAVRSPPTPPLRPPGRHRGRRIEPSGQVRVRRPAQPAGRRVRRKGVRRQPRRRRDPRAGDGHRGRAAPVRRSRPRRRVHAAGGQPRRAAGLRRHRREGGLCRLRRLPGDRRRRAGGPRRSSWRWPTSSTSCWPAPTARGWCRPRPGCAPRSSGRTRRPAPISVVSQSGNTVSSFLNYAAQTGVGIARAVSAGNAAAVTVTDYLQWYRDDPATRVAFAYLEHSADGRATFDGMRAVDRRAAGRAGQGRRHRRRAAGGGVAHRGAGGGAAHLHRRHAPGRRVPGPHRRGGVRRRRHLRHATAAPAGPTPWW